MSIGPADSGVLHFSGYAIREGRLITGSEADGFLWSQPCNGHYTAVEKAGDIVSVHSDAFGIGVLYLYRSRGVSIVSNNLHLITTVCRRADHPLTIHEASLIKRLYPRHIGQQPSGAKAYFDEITILNAGEFVEIDGSLAKISKYSYQSYPNYKSALDAGINELLDYTYAVLQFTDCLVYRLSGGYDSRVVFGALSKLGALDKSYCWTFPHMESDFDVVKQLIGTFGGRFANQFPWLTGSEPKNIDDAYASWASQNFGLYNTELGFESHHRTAFDHTTTGVLFGGGGECFRDFYFTDHDVDEAGAVERLIEINTSRLFPSLAPKAGQIASLFAEDILSQSGETARQKLRQHYTNYRNRFHFGGPTSSKANRMTFCPFMQPAFVDASDHLRREGKDLNFLLRDIFLELDTRLLDIKFDKPHKNLGPIKDHPQAEYRPEQLAGTSKPALYSRSEKESFFEEKLKIAIETINDSGLYRDFDLCGYVDAMKSRKASHPKRFTDDAASLISTSHLIA